MSPGSRQRKLLGEGAKKTIIFEAELLAVVCAMKLWQKHIMGAPVVFYIDNNSARDVAMSGSGRAEIPKALLEQLLFREQQSQVVAWYQRVPSPSNIADLPSRQKCASLTSQIRLVRCESALAELADIEKLLSGKEG